MEKLTASILIIGNEILSGRTQDTNLAFIAKKLNDYGIDLKEVRVVPDEKGAIIEAVNTLRKNNTYLITTGGIGSTHDDITVACIAEAFGRPLEENKEALECLKEHYKDRLNSIRRRMALMPQDIILINNPVSCAPSFQIDNVFVLAGMPSVMQGMMEDVSLKLKKDTPFQTKTITCDLLEGIIADALTDIQYQYPAVFIGSYPFYRSSSDMGVTFSLRSKNSNLLDTAYHDVSEMVKTFGGLIRNS